MPTKDERDVTLYVDGVAISEIPEFEFDEAQCIESISSYIHPNSKFITCPEEGVSFTLTCKINKEILMKLAGFYDYVLKYCPNRRTAHLMKYHKNERTRFKNFKRSYREIIKLYNRQRIHKV